MHRRHETGDKRAFSSIVVLPSCPESVVGNISSCSPMTTRQNNWGIFPSRCIFRTFVKKSYKGWKVRSGRPTIIIRMWNWVRRPESIEGTMSHYNKDKCPAHSEPSPFVFTYLLTHSLVTTPWLSLKKRCWATEKALLRSFLGQSEVWWSLSLFWDARSAIHILIMANFSLFQHWIILSVFLDDIYYPEIFCPFPCSGLISWSLIADHYSCSQPSRNRWYCDESRNDLLCDILSIAGTMISATWTNQWI